MHIFARKDQQVLSVLFGTFIGFGIEEGGGRKPYFIDLLVS